MKYLYKYPQVEYPYVGSPKRCVLRPQELRKLNEVTCMRAITVEPKKPGTAKWEEVQEPDGRRTSQAPSRGEITISRSSSNSSKRRKQNLLQLIADRSTGKIVGCHVVGDRAVEIAQVVAIAIAGGLRVDSMARIPLSFPTYAGILARAAYRAAQQIYPEFRGQDAVVEK